MSDIPHENQFEQPADSVWTISSILNWTKDFFQHKDIENPRLDAELLLSSVLGVERIQLYVQFNRVPAEDQRNRFRSLVKRRASREPLSRILGYARFMGYELKINPHVMSPRPETELMVEWALERTAKSGHKPAFAADIGTGSGAIAVSLAAGNEFIEAAATDISMDALKTAGENASALGVDDRVRFLRGDLLAPLEAEALQGQFDYILSNPPYIPRHELDSLMPEVRDYDPVIALDGGEDGLDYYRKIIPSAPEFLKPGGWLALEVGAGQAPAVSEMARSAGFALVEIKHDLAGIQRIVLGRM